MSSHRDYETLYGVGLLDDLHNYFPAILYDPSSFRSGREMIEYIQEQARNRFDLFSLGQREYRGSHSPPPVPAHVPPVTTVPSVRLNTLSSDISGNTNARNSILQPNNNPPHPVRTPRNRTFNTAIEYMWNVIPEPEEEIPMTSQLLAALMNLPLTRNYNIPLRNGGLDNFMQPVVVRPTPEQIAANTTIGNLASDEDHSCAICQDVLAPEQEGRKLNACGHWFHRSCIDTWFERDVHCPVCRHDIREASVEPAQATSAQ